MSCRLPHVTYLLGAGASYNSMPVVSELTEDMRALSGLLDRIGDRRVFLSDVPDSRRGSLEERLNDIGEIAQKASRFYSIDTYARYLHLWRRHRRFRDDARQLTEALDIYFASTQFHPSPIR